MYVIIDSGAASAAVTVLTEQDVDHDDELLALQLIASGTTYLLTSHPHSSVTLRDDDLAGAPAEVTDEKRARVEQAAQAVLDARAAFPDATLADLYDLNAVPPALRQAHDALDRAVDRCYRNQPFTSERQRLEFLFNLYEQLIAPLAPRASRGRRRRV